ncbi:hypothetical protein EUGRSUZ_D01885 [Eucalyptus grandis]|uniref:Uncharacterized protein n=2 Tax=Eucalyptus grandis TaxID=71139 RepID=A0ACC3L787_EUCGR|nr:hypothetical protein EUGRSUZ_D01885 [Eucalyptus grandis]
MAGTPTFIQRHFSLLPCKYRTLHEMQKMNHLPQQQSSGKLQRLHSTLKNIFFSPLSDKAIACYPSKLTSAAFYHSCFIRKRKTRLEVQ